MILSKFVFTKISPSNIKYWKSKGYEVGTTGGRGGKNTGKRIKVRVEDLQAGSNIKVSCKCEHCGKKFLRKFCSTHKDLCNDCLNKVFNSEKMKGNSFGKKHDLHLIPPKEELEEMIRSGRGSRLEIAKKYNTTSMIVSRWLKDREINVDKTFFITKKESPPEGFIEWFKEYKPTKTEASKKYNVLWRQVEMWIKEYDLPYKSITGKLTTPDLEEMVELNQTLTTLQLAEHYGVSHSKIVDWFSKNNIRLKNHGTAGTSKEETSMFDFIKSFDDRFIQGAKSIFENGKLQLDIYNPETKIAFEYDGIFWHSSSKRFDHRMKVDLCTEKGITLFRINSHEWTTQNDLVKSMIKSKLGFIENRLFARNLIVKEISKSAAEEHHKNFHIAGFGNSSVNLGLFDKENLISVMSFSKSRYKDYNAEWELNRFSTILNTIVVGGASKIFSYFIKTYNPKSILSFSDVRLNTGKVYPTLGFKFIKRGDPTYWYYSSNFPEIRFSRQAFQKHKLEKKLKIFDPNLTEEENMAKNKYFKYWDCGSDHYLWEAK